MKKLLLHVPIFLFILVGCGGETSGSDNNSAEGAALLFFESIYNKKNFEAALNVASPRLQRLMKSYHTPKGVARHIINLRYEGDVKLEIDGGNSVGRAEFATEQKVSIFISGNYQGDKIDELRTVDMKKVNGKWVVDAILADRFL